MLINALRAAGPVASITRNARIYCPWLMALETALITSRLDFRRRWLGREYAVWRNREDEETLARFDDVGGLAVEDVAFHTSRPLIFTVEWQL